MEGMGPEVGSGEQPIVRELPLEAQVPLLRGRDLGVQRQVVVTAFRGEDVAFGRREGGWEGVAPRIVLVRRGQTRLASPHQSARRSGGATVGAGINGKAASIRKGD